MTCDVKRVVGRMSTLSVAIQCTTEDPAATTFKPLGAVTTKSYSYAGNTIELNDSSMVTGFTENQLSGGSLSISVSGNYVNDESEYANAQSINDIEQEFFDAIADPTLSKQPIILVKYVRGGKTLTAYCVITAFNIEDPTKELSTWSMEFAIAASPTYPPTLVDTV